MNIYEIPPEYLMSNYRVGTDGNLYKITSQGEVKRLSKNQQGITRYTDDLGNRYGISEGVIRGMVDRVRGFFNNRKRLHPPFDNYEVKRDGTFWNFKNPHVQIHSDSFSTIRLVDNKTQLKNSFNIIEVVAKMFLYELSIEEFNNFSIVTNIPYGALLTTNHCDDDKTFISFQNTALVRNDLVSNDMILITELPNYVLDRANHIVIDCGKRVRVPFFNKGNSILNRTFLIEQYNYHKRQYIINYFNDPIK